MSIKFILDTREHSLQSLFIKNSIPFETKQLDLGDIVILYSKNGFKDEIKNDLNMSTSAKKLLGIKQDNQENKETDKQDSKDNDVYTIVIERKTYTDLKASMSDGRYHEQKSRYLQLSKGCCYYILENNDPNFKELGKKQFLGTFFHTIVRDGIFVFLTNSLTDTYDYLIKIGETLKEYGPSNSAKVCEIQKTQIKKKKSTTKEIYIEQLSCIPGISSGKATLIAEKYSSMKELINSLETNNFQVKGIGKVLINNIKENLLLLGTSKLDNKDNKDSKTNVSILFDE